MRRAKAIQPWRDPATGSEAGGADCVEIQIDCRGHIVRDRARRGLALLASLLRNGEAHGDRGDGD